MATKSNHLGLFNVGDDVRSLQSLSQPSSLPLSNASISRQTLATKDQTPTFRTSSNLVPSTQTDTSFCSFLRTCLLLLLCAGSEHLAPATDVLTETYVASATSILGSNPTNSPLTLFSQRTVRPVQHAGTVTSSQGATLTDTNAAWTNGQFGTNGTPAYVEFDNGWRVDIADTAAGSNTLLLASTLSGIASVGDAYRLRAHTTVASLFGTNNETGLVGGPNPAKADNILLLIPQTQKTLTIFYYSNTNVTPFQGWVRGDTFAPVPNQVIYPEQGVIVRRMATNNASLYLTGSVKTGVTVAPVQPGYNFLGTLKTISSLSLSNLNLYTGDSTTGVVGGRNSSVADNLIVVQSDGSVMTYFYYLYPGVFQGWVNAKDFTPSGDVQIAAGSMFLINRQTPGGFDWTIPAE